MSTQKTGSELATPLRKAADVNDIGVRLLVDNVVDYAIMLLDLGGHILTWNKGAELLKGYSADEIIGRHFSIFYTPDDLEAGKPARELQEAEDQGRIEDESWRVRKDGSQFWANVVLTALRDETGVLRGFGKVTRDFTARVEAEGDKFRMAVESAPNAMVMINRDGKIVLVNSQTEKVFGYPRAELIGQRVELLVPEKFRSQHPAHRKKYFNTPQNRAMGEGKELFGRRKDGSEFPVEIALNPIHSREGLFVISAIVDITERKQADLALRAIHETLEQRVVDRTAQLDTANKELDAFSYSVSHDLRAPLRAIDGFSRILLEEFPGLSPEGIRDYLQKIRSTTQQMGQLVEDLLAFAHLGRQAIKKQSADSNAIVRTCLAEMTTEQEGRQIEIVIGDLPPCQADPALLKQVWTNLLSNALKYTGKRPIAIIEIGCCTEPSTQVDDCVDRTSGERLKKVYFVQDNGAGFDMSYADKLFGVFQRLHRASDYKGTGVGMAIAQRIVQSHGGRIWAEAKVDEGATFFFTLE